MSATRHIRQDIQGLRGIAVLSVVIFHAVPAYLPGGFTGVDIFFVISGYLITSILTRELDNGKFSITSFYERRIRRLFPALFAVLAVCLIVGTLFLSPHEYRELAATTFSTIFFYSNIAFFNVSNYFEGSSDFKPLLHTWSLAVEEQFYLLFPLALAAFHKRARRWLPAIFIAILVLSLVASAYATQHTPAAAFYLAPYRAFELLIGALLVFTPSILSNQPKLRDSLSLLGLALIIASMIVINQTTPFPGVVALLPCVGTALLLYTGREADTLGGRLISFSALTFFGALSYSLYLWHWPFLAFGHHFAFGIPPLSLTALLVGASIMTAWASWRWIEQPFLKPAPKTPRPPWASRTLQTGIALMAVAALLAVGLHRTGGLPNRFAPEAIALFDAKDDYNHQRDSCHSPFDYSIPYTDNCVYGAPGAEPSIVVWGDSHGTELMIPLGEQLARTNSAAMQITASGCPPSLDFAPVDIHPLCAGHNRETLEALIQDPRIDTVIMAANYGLYVRWENFSDGFARIAEALHASGKSVILIHQIPTFDFDVPYTLGKQHARGHMLQETGIPIEEFERTNKRAEEFLEDLSARTNAIALHPSDALCDANVCHAYDPQIGSLYFNDSHLSIDGARMVLTHIAPDLLGLRQHAALAATRPHTH